MTAPTIAATLDALAAKLALVPTPDGTATLNVQDTVPGQVTPPAAVLWVDSITYATSQNSASHDLTVAVLLLASDASSEDGQELLLAYLEPTGTSSVYAALDADPDLGQAGLIAMVTAVPEGQAGRVQYGGVEYQGARLNVGVMLG
jgi:hypothetical protein